MNGLIIKLPSAVTDTSLLKLGEFRVDFTARGDKSKVTTVQLVALGAITATITGGTFHTDAAGTSTGTSTINLVTGNNVFHIKATSDKGSFSLTDKKNIGQLGVGTSDFIRTNDPTNAPYFELDVDQIPKSITSFASVSSQASLVLVGDISKLSALKSLTYFRFGVSDTLLIPKVNLKGTLSSLSSTVVNFGFLTTNINYDFTIELKAFEAAVNITNIDLYGGKVTGSLSSLSGLSKLNAYFAGTISDATTGSLASLSGLALLRTFQSKSTQINGSLNDIPSTIETFVTESPNISATYTSRSWGTTMSRLDIKTVPITAASGDLILADLVNVATWTGGKNLTLRARTTASNASVSNLQAKGVSITVVLPV